MSTVQVLLVCNETDFDAARALADEVFAAWPGGDKPKLRTLHPRDIGRLDGQFTTVDVVWVYAESMPRSEMYVVLDQLEQWRMPMMLTRGDECELPGGAFDSGVVCGPKSSGAFTLRMILQSLSSQAMNLREMKLELQMMKRTQLGMRKQMDNLDEELRLAARIQRQFIPEVLPSFPGVSFDVLFRPAGYVSGDIYDVQRLDEHHLGFYIADAVGHGMPAALMTMFINRSLKTKEIGRGTYRILRPDEAMARLNHDLLTKPSPAVQFVTACYGTLNLTTRELCLARAGHPPPFLLRGDGRVETLTPDGPLLGVFEDEPFETVSVKLDAGDRLLLYSDGFEVAFGDAKNPMNQCYIGELHQLRDGTMHDALQRLEAKLDSSAGSLHQRDDLTALMLDVAA
jgi:sigma-B regulation protein RsbU (phosphoserine phosphatase)